MSLGFRSVLLAAAFASQIIVLSFYVPQRWGQYHARMIRRYPPEQYLRLYPLPKQIIESKLILFRRVQFGIGCFAALVLVAALIQSPSSKVFAAYMSGILVLQLGVVLYIAMPLGIKISKAFRGMRPSSARSAELRPWRITDFVSPSWIVFGLVLQTLGLACVAVGYLYWPKALPPAVILMASGVVLLGIMVYSLFSPRGFSRPDPYMSDADTFSERQRRYRVRFLAGALNGPGEALIVLSCAPFMHIENADVCISVSVVIQLWALWFISSQLQDLEKRDFSVYRDDSPRHVAP
jgi:hypothetical protein